jgi:iron complex transport system ATP-binding protein
MIELRQTDFAFAERAILKSVDFDMKAGELVAIIGPNGAGKSTLLKVIGGLLRASAGSVRVWQRDPYTERRRELAKRMAYLSQSYRMAFPFRAIEVVLMGRYAHNRRGILGLDSEGDHELALQALKQCDVAELAERRIDQLSGGEQRRVLIAQALCQGAELLLLDEPTAGLDPKHARNLFALLRAQTHSKEQVKSCLVVTHDLNLAARFADRILLLEQGERVALASPDELLTSGAAERVFGVHLQCGTLPNSQQYVVPY